MMMRRAVVDVHGDAYIRSDVNTRAYCRLYRGSLDFKGETPSDRKIK